MNETERLLKAKIPCAETGIDVKHTLCDICCPSFHCGIDAYVKDGKVVKIEGTADHPVNHGLLCPKGLSNRQMCIRDRCDFLLGLYQMVSSLPAPFHLFLRFT